MYFSSNPEIKAMVCVTPKYHDLDTEKGEGKKHFYLNFPGTLSFALRSVNAKKFQITQQKSLLQDRIHPI